MTDVLLSPLIHCRLSCTDEQGLKAEKEKITLRMQATRNDKLKEAVMAAGNDHLSTVASTGMLTVVTMAMCLIHIRVEVLTYSFDKC